MRIFTEFIILSEDLPMMDYELLFPLMWQAKEFDSDGNFYSNFPENKWSNLVLTVFSEDKTIELSRVNIDVCREDSNAIASSNNLLQLAYLEEKKIHGYAFFPPLTIIQMLAATSITINTINENLYIDFLKSVYKFLVYTKGYIVNCGMLDAEKFKQEFL